MDTFGHLQPPTFLAKSCNCSCDEYRTCQVPKICFRSVIHEICCTNFGHDFYITAKVKSNDQELIQSDPISKLKLSGNHIACSFWQFLVGSVLWKWNELPHDTTNKMTVHPAKTQISLGLHPVWSESSLFAWRELGSLAAHWAHSEDSDQTGRMPRLIWVFVGRIVILLVLSWGSSNSFPIIYSQVMGS